MSYDPNQPYQQSQYAPPNQGYPQPGYPPQSYQPPMMQNPAAAQLGKSSIGDLDANLAAALSYFWIIGLVFFIIEKRSKFVRFHALQALLYGVALFIVAVVLEFLPFIFFVGYLIHLAWLLGAIYSAVQAYNGQWFKLPIVGDIAYNNAMAWNPMMGGPQGGYPPQQGGYPPQPGQWPQQ